MTGLLFRLDLAYVGRYDLNITSSRIYAKYLLIYASE
jgi:hypothetical protein